jgi:hypothetical protein
LLMCVRPKVVLLHLKQHSFFLLSCLRRQKLIESIIVHLVFDDSVLNLLSGDAFC